MRRYDAVIHLRTPTLLNGYNNRNPLRVESVAEAESVDERLVTVWAAHPRRFVVDATPDFLVKAKLALAIVRGELPDCCRRHLVPTPDDSGM